jgi:hypothetical protein
MKDRVRRAEAFETAVEKVGGNPLACIVHLESMTS